MPARNLQRAAAWHWLLQVLVFSVTSAALLCAPRFTLALLRAHALADLTPDALAAQPQLVVDQVRSLGALWLPSAAMASLGVLRDDGPFRRSLARVFALFLFAWSLAEALSVGTGRYGRLSLVAALVAVALWLANTVFALGPRPAGARPLDLGSSDGRPPLLWLVWLVQCATSTLLAAVLACWPMRALAWVAAPDAWAQTSAVERAIAADQVRHLGALVWLFALLSAIALVQDRVALWRTFRQVFATTQFAFAALALVHVATGSWSLGAAGAILGLVVPAGALNLWVGAEEAAVTDDDDAADLEFWSALDLVLGPWMLLRTLVTRRRATHPHGVGARGRFLVSPAPEVPAQRVFSPGRAFSVVVRFANEHLDDDAGLDVRGAALSLLDGPDRIDLLLNTGAVSAAHHVLSYAAVGLWRRCPVWLRAWHLSHHPEALGALVAGLRRAPESFARLCFHSQKVSYWVDTEGERWLVRYRLVPSDGATETGLPDDDDGTHPWLTAREASDERPRDYLRRELHARIARGPVTMRLQAQWHEERAGDPLAWFDPGLAWDAHEHPWWGVGTLTLDAATSDDETERMRFNPGWVPASLGVPASSGPRDPRSLADSERRVMWRLGKLREALHASFGLPRLADAVRSSR